MENKKFIGMNKNIVLGLSYILFPFAIVALAVDHAKMDKEDKLDFVQSLVFEGIGVIFSTVASILTAIGTAINTDAAIIIFNLIAVVLSIPLVIFWIIALVKSFKGNHYEMPICYGIANKFVKDNGQVEAAPVEEAEVEVEEEKVEEVPVEEEKAEEAPVEEEKAE